MQCMQSGTTHNLPVYEAVLKLMQGDIKTKYYSKYIDLYHNNG